MDIYITNPNPTPLVETETKIKKININFSSLLNYVFQTNLIYELLAVTNSQPSNKGWKNCTEGPECRTLSSIRIGVP